MKILSKKVFRELILHKWQFFAMVVMVFVGVGMYVASYDAYLNLRASYDQTHINYEFADIWLQVTHVDDEILEDITAHKEVGIAEPRLVLDVFGRVPGENRVTARIIGIPFRHQSIMNRLHLTEGEYLTSESDSVLVENHFAEHYDLHPGDQIELSTGDRYTTYTIAGNVISPEYIWPARSHQEIISSPENFGVFFLAAEELQSLVGLGDFNNEILVRLAEGSDEEERARMETVLQRDIPSEAFVNSYIKEEQPANEMLTLDLEGFAELAYFFPILFLMITGFTISVMMTRMVSQQQRQIGVLKANGFSNRTIRWLYLSYGMIVALVGAIGGVVLGVLLANSITVLYTQMLSIPIVITKVRLTTMLTGVSLAVLACLISAFLPAQRAARVKPAQSLRGAVGERGRKYFRIDRWFPLVKFFPSPLKIAVRNIDRKKGRSLLNIFGVVAAMVMILVSWGMIDSVEHMVDRMFNEIYQEDLLVTYKEPITDDDLAEVDDLAGVVDYEKGVYIPATIRVINRSTTDTEQVYETAIIALPADTKMHGFWNMENETIPFKYSSVFIGQGIQNEIEIKKGDRIEVGITLPGVSSMENAADQQEIGQVLVDNNEPLSPELILEDFPLNEVPQELPPTEENELLLDQVPLIPQFLRAEVEFEVTEFVNEPIGSLLYVSYENLQDQFDEQGLPMIENTLYMQVEEGSRKEIRNQMNDWDTVLQVQDTRVLYDLVQVLLNLFFVIIGVMLIFGGIMAFGIIFNTMTVSILERAREFATLRTLGFSNLMISIIVSLENLILTIIALPIGLIAGKYVAYYGLMSYNTDFFQFEVVFKPTTYVLVVIFITITAMLSQIPAIYWISRIDLTRMIKDRTS